VHKQDYAKATALCDAVIKESAKSSVLAEAWVRKGDALLAQRTWDDAALAYLHVPVFMKTRSSGCLPRSSAARAPSAVLMTWTERRNLNDLTARFPKSAQADTARTELQKLGK
jgi:hypothetical protein